MKMDHVEIIKKTKKTLDLIAWLVVIISLIGIYFKVLNETFSWLDGVSLLITGFIVYSLYEAKEWAKIYITISSGLTILMIFPGIIKSAIGFNIPIFVISTLFLLWNAYVIKFLNSGDIYDKYQKLVQKGYDFKENKKVEISEIIDSKKMIPIDFRSFKSKEDYLAFTKLIFDILDMKSFIEKIYSEGESKIYVESEELIFELEFDINSVFFDKNYINGLNVIMEKLRNDGRYLDLVYPNSTLDKLERKITLANGEEFMELKKYGYYE